MKATLRRLTRLLRPKARVSTNPDAPYGVTWADEDDTLYQTGYVFEEVSAAADFGGWILREGLKPFMRDTQIDELTTGGYERKPLYAYVETEDDTVLRIALADILARAGAA